MPRLSLIVAVRRRWSLPRLSLIVAVMRRWSLPRLLKELYALQLYMEFFRGQ